MIDLFLKCFGNLKARYLIFLGVGEISVKTFQRVLFEDILKGEMIYDKEEEGILRREKNMYRDKKLYVILENCQVYGGYGERYDQGLDYLQYLVFLDFFLRQWLVIGGF